MISDSSSGRALRGYLSLSAITFGRHVRVFAVILALIIATMVAGTALVAAYGTAEGATSGGALSGGFLVAIISLSAIGFGLASSTTMDRIFAFPMSRSVLFVGNAIVIAMAALTYTYLISLVGGLEVLAGRLIAGLVPRLIFSNSITLGSYMLGFFISFSYLVWFMSGAYALGMYISRYRLPTMVLLGLGLVSIFAFKSAYQVVVDVYYWFFNEGSPSILTAKLWGTTALAHAATLLPLRGLEVRS